MTPRYCSICHHRFIPDKDSNAWQCEPCRRWVAYLCSHPQPEKKYISVMPELRFAFDDPWVVRKEQEMFDVMILGKTKHDSTHQIMTIYLKKFNDTDDSIRDLINTLIHEFTHYLLFSQEGFETSKAYDKIASKLEKWLEEN